MARGARVRPVRLPEKLLQIRLNLDLSQSELLKRLGFEDIMDYRRISEFERGTTEPNLVILLRYARVAGVYMEDIVDDELDLPEKLPGSVRYRSNGRNHIARREKVES